MKRKCKTRNPWGITANAALVIGSDGTPIAMPSRAAARWVAGNWKNSTQRVRVVRLRSTVSRNGRRVVIEVAE